MSRFPIRSSRRVVVRRQPIRNMMLDGGGASGNGDRGALQHAAQRTSNPYYSNNFLYRWQEYYNDLVCRLSRELSCPLLDLRPEFLRSPVFPSLISADGIHPTQAGHDLVHRCALDAVGNL